MASSRLEPPAAPTEISLAVIDEIFGWGDVGVLTDYSLLACLGQVGRSLTYDADHARELRFSLMQCARTAIDIYWATVGSSHPDVLRQQILAESRRAHRKHQTHGGSLFQDSVTLAARLAALVEECGEYAEEMAGQRITKELIKELIQIVNVCLSWVTHSDYVKWRHQLTEEIATFRPSLGSPESGAYGIPQTRSDR